VVIKLWIGIREVLDSNLDLHIDYHEIFRGLTQSHNTNAGTVPRLSQDLSFQVHE
jgi:hypothetical protein